MQHANHNDAGLDQCEVQTVWEIGNQSASFRRINSCEAEGAGTHTRDSLVDRRAKPVSEAGTSLLIPLLGIQEFALGLRSEDDRQTHRPA
jgi:hypothetical protein